MAGPAGALGRGLAGAVGRRPESARPPQWGTPARAHAPALTGRRGLAHGAGSSVRTCFLPVLEPLAGGSGLFSWVFVGGAWALHRPTPHTADAQQAAPGIEPGEARVSQRLAGSQDAQERMDPSVTRKNTDEK